MNINQSLHDNGDLRRWYAQIPNLICDMGLSPYAGWLYIHYKRICGAGGGSCDEGSRQTAESCRMSVGSVASAKRELFEAGLINVFVSKRGNRTHHRITIVDIWEQNFKRFSKDEVLSIDDIKNAIQRDPSTPYFCDTGTFIPTPDRSPDEPKQNPRSDSEPTPTPDRSSHEAADRSPDEHKNNKKEGTVDSSEKIVDSSIQEKEDDPHSIIGSAVQPVNHYDTSLDPTWSNCQGAFELQLGKAVYENWIADVKFVGFSDGTLTLLTRNRYDQLWLSNNKAQAIIRSYSSIRQCDVSALQLVNPYSDPVTVQRQQPNPPTPTPPPHVKLKSALVS